MPYSRDDDEIGALAWHLQKTDGYYQRDDIVCVRLLDI